MVILTSSSLTLPLLLLPCHPQWGTTSLHVRGKEVPVKRLQFMTTAAPKAGDAA